MGWIATAIMAVAAWSLSPARRWPFLLFIAGDILWAGVGLGLGRPDLVAVNVMFLVLSARNWLKWSVR